MEDQLPPESKPATAALAENPVIWHLFSRIAFRFWFLYFVGNFFPIVDPVVSWIAARVFRATLPVVVSGSGSGDKTYDWVKAFCVLGVAACGTLIWSMLDRRRPNYIALQRWFHLLLRFSLGAIMLTYGWMKIVPLQMPYPSLTRLLQPFGEFSPMGVLWSSVGASPAYEIFTGFVEVVLPFTSRFGVLLCLAASTQIFVLNMTYDVPVKLYSFLLILRSLVLLEPDLPRLVKFVFSKGPVDAAPSGELFVSPARTGLLTSCRFC